MSTGLATTVAGFLAHKRALGRKYLTEDATLRLLVVFCIQHGVTELEELTPSLLNAFIASRPRARARSFNHLVGVLGCFLDWVVCQQHLEASPLVRTRRRETERRLPFLFDVTQARRLLEAAAALKQAVNSCHCHSVVLHLHHEGYILLSPQLLLHSLVECLDVFRRVCVLQREEWPHVRLLGAFHHFRINSTALHRASRAAGVRQVGVPALQLLQLRHRSVVLCVRE